MSSHFLTSTLQRLGLVSDSGRFLTAPDCFLSLVVSDCCALVRLMVRPRLLVVVFYICLRPGSGCVLLLHVFRFWWCSNCSPVVGSVSDFVAVPLWLCSVSGCVLISVIFWVCPCSVSVCGCCVVVRGSNGPHVVTISVVSDSPSSPLVLTLLGVPSLAVHVFRRRPSLWFPSDSGARTGWLFFFFGIFCKFRRVSVSGFY